MSDVKPEDDKPTEIRKGGASGKRADLRKGLQAFVLVAFLILLFTVIPPADRRVYIFGTMILVVFVDLILLWRGDLDWTHFQSRQWSFRINVVLLAIAVALFTVALTDRW
jgi:hypothetical protein